MRRQRKPTGSIGAISISSAGDVTFEKVSFPAEKAEVEGFVVELTVHALQEANLNPWGAVPRRNPEQHFDFTIPSPNGEAYLDLMEIAPLDGQGGFQNATLDYHHGQIADWVWAKLTQKARKYGLPRELSVHLLLYSTDLAFRLSAGVLDLLSYYCSVADRGFMSILYAVPEDATSVSITTVCPRERSEFRRFNLAAKRERSSLLADFTRREVTGTTSVSVPLGGRRSDEGR